MVEGVNQRASLVFRVAGGAFRPHFDGVEGGGVGVIRASWRGPLSNLLRLPSQMVRMDSLCRDTETPRH